MKIRAFAILITVFLLAWSGIAAQEIPEDTAATIVQTAASVTFEETGDEIYTLTLNDISASASVLIYQPGLGAGFYTAEELVADWTYGEGDALVGQALLQAGTQTLDLRLSEPVYDEETMSFSYTATIESIFDLEAEEGKDALPEESYGEATLFILADFDFISDLEARRVARIDDGRLSTVQSCFPGRSC